VLFGGYCRRSCGVKAMTYMLSPEGEKSLYSLYSCFLSDQVFSSDYTQCKISGKVLISKESLSCPEKLNGGKRYQYLHQLP
jgi:hypothetical protein